MSAKTPPDALEQLYQIAGACIAIDNGIAAVKALLGKEPDVDIIESLDSIAASNASSGTAIRHLTERLKHPE